MQEQLAGRSSKRGGADAGARPERALPPFGARDRLFSAASAVAYGALLVGAALWARSSGAAGCALAGGRWFGAEVPRYLPLFGLPVAAITAGLIQRRRHDAEGGRLTSGILLFLGLVSGVPLSGVVPWALMSVGYCIDGSSIRETTLRGTGEPLAFAQVASAEEARDHLLLRGPAALDSPRSHDMRVDLSSMRDPDGLRLELMSALRHVGLHYWYEGAAAPGEIPGVDSGGEGATDGAATAPEAGADTSTAAIPRVPTLDVAAWRRTLDAEDLAAIDASRWEGEVRWRVTVRGGAPEDLEAMRARCAALQAKAAPYLQPGGRPDLVGPDERRSFRLAYESSDLVAITRLDAGAGRLVTTIEGGGVVWKDRAAYPERRGHDHDEDWLSLLERLRRAHGLRFHVKAFTLPVHEDTSRPELTLPDDWEARPAARTRAAAREAWRALSDHYRKYHRWPMAPVRLYANDVRKGAIQGGSLVSAEAD